MSQKAKESNLCLDYEKLGNGVVVLTGRIAEKSITASKKTVCLVSIILKLGHQLK